MDANGAPWLGARRRIVARRCRRPAQPALARPWRTWLLLSWAICTLASPTFAFVVVLLCIDARSDNPYFWWSLPSSSPPAMPSRSCAPTIVMAAVAMPTAPRWRATRRHRPGHGRRPVPGGGRRLGLLPELAAMLLGTRDAGPAALGGIALAMGFGVASHVHAGALHAWLAFREPAAAMRRRPARADGGSTPPGHRHQRALSAGRRRHQDASRIAPARHAGAARVKPAPARRTAQKLAAGASVARHCARGRRQRCTALRAEPTARGLRRAASAAGKRGLAGLRIQVRITVGSVLAVPVAV